jgi:hypothetical protein
MTGLGPQLHHQDAVDILHGAVDEDASLLAPLFEQGLSDLGAFLAFELPATHAAGRAQQFGNGQSRRKLLDAVAHACKSSTPLAAVNRGIGVLNATRYGCAKQGQDHKTGLTYLQLLLLCRASPDPGRLGNQPWVKVRSAAGQFSVGVNTQFGSLAPGRRSDDAWSAVSSRRRPA